MKENGKMIKKKELEYIINMMELDIKENGKIIYLMVMEYIIVLIINGDMKVNLKNGLKKEMEYNIFQKDLYIKENGARWRKSMWWISTTRRPPTISGNP